MLATTAATAPGMAQLVTNCTVTKTADPSAPTGFQYFVTGSVTNTGTTQTGWLHGLKVLAYDPQNTYLRTFKDRGWATILYPGETVTSPAYPGVPRASILCDRGRTGNADLGFPALTIDLPESRRDAVMTAAEALELAAAIRELTSAPTGTAGRLTLVAGAA